MQPESEPRMLEYSAQEFTSWSTLAHFEGIATIVSLIFSVSYSHNSNEVTESGASITACHASYKTRSSVARYLRGFDPASLRAKRDHLELIN